MEITKERLQAAGWLCYLWAVVSVPAAVAYMVLGNATALYLDLLAALIVVGGLIVVLRVLLTLKAFLVQVFSYHEAKGALGLLLVTHLVFGAMLLVWPFVPGGQAEPELRGPGPGLGLFFLGLWVVLAFAQGTGFFILGTKVLGLPDGLFGNRQRLGYASMAMGLCFGSVVLFPVGVLVGVAWLVLLGVTFQRVGGRLREA